MKILLCHNYYQQPGGEDQVFADEAWLLEHHGHEVVRYARHNDEINRMRRWSIAGQSFWSRRTYRELTDLIRRTRPDVMHCTNTFPLISPSAFYAARDEGVPVVQSLHNYRLFCPSALLMREQKPCEDCLGKRFALPGVLRGCYRESRLGTAVLASATAVHRAGGTWTRLVDRYIALSEFSRSRFIQGGLPAEKIAVKPNFVHPDPGPGVGGGGYAVFVGRLAEEKGIDTLLDGWKTLDANVPLVVIGDGPLAAHVEDAARDDRRIRWLGRLENGETRRWIADAACLMLPSLCYENCPKVLLEAYAAGTPVVASRLGAMEEMVHHGVTGLHFSAGDAMDLAAAIAEGFRESKFQQMRSAARDEFDARYTAQANYDQLLDIYESSRTRKSLAAML